MRKWVLRVHLYAGLLCSSYLILFGLSSLLFNHPLSFAARKTDAITWERKTARVRIGDQSAEARALRYDLGLIGWTHEEERDKAGNLRFRVSRPGRDYSVEVRYSQAKVRVRESREGVWQIVRKLHGLTHVDNSRWMAGWGWYTEVCTLVGMFAAASGLYIWASKKARHATGWAILGGAAALSLLLMTYIRVWG